MKTYKQSCKQLTQELIHVRKELNQLLRRINSLRTAQATHGQFIADLSKDRYFIGKYNGIEDALAMLEKRSPSYIDMPDIRPANCMMIPAKPEIIQSAESGGLT